jgi:hypothetical protein
MECYRFREERNILQTRKRRTVNCIVHISRRNCLLKEVRIKRRKYWREDEEEDVSSYFVT